jgi:hypothetical protein
MLRQAFINGDEDKTETIKGLFKNKEIPTLTTLLKEDYGKLVAAEEASITDQFAKPEGQANWWDAAQVKGEDGNSVNLLNSSEPQQKYGRPGFQWKPHGPTATPYLDAFPGVNPTAAPGAGGLDTYYQMWLDYTDTQDQTECALIHPDARVKCMDNYDALKDYNENTQRCKNAGCCFNEEAFMQGNHACYRASDYGTCANLPTDFSKKECGYDGISEVECLTNARCCYKPTHVAGTPWCFYKYSATLEEDKWCEAWNLQENRKKPRSACFENNTKKDNLFNGSDNSMSNINNLISKEQCEAAGCCFDPELTSSALDWIVEGLGQTNHIYRCFSKQNPALIADPDSGKTQYEEINRSKNGDGELLAENKSFGANDPIMTCDVASWVNPNAVKSSCGDNLSYYQCVYINKCCYKATVTNEPNCFNPDERA